MSENPYSDLDPRAFWRPSVSDRSPFDVADLWTPKHPVVQRTRVSTYGSCFAQHFGRALQRRGFGWLLAETPPEGLSEATANTFSYGQFSSRPGNIYTTSLLRQWTDWAIAGGHGPEEVWKKDERYYDPFRPRVEPNGFASAEEVLASRAVTIAAFRSSIETADTLVFTLGLTESWVNIETDYEYPMCPGTVAGDFNPQRHVFRNQNYPTVRANLVEAIRLMRSVNPKLRFLLTVSPVPLTATKSDNHVIVATTHSKSILRAVAGAVAEEQRIVDYFPSYEIITSPVFKGMFFEPNQRSVNPNGVQFVMKHFFAGQERTFGLTLDDADAGRASRASARDAACEEELLDAFRA